MAITMGIDIGQKRDHSALCVAESVTRENGDRSAVHHLVRHLERLPLATPFPDIAARAGSVAAAIDRRVRCSPEIFIDATGVGMPVVDLVREAVAVARAVTPVFFTHGDRRTVLGTPWRPEVQLGKAYLVSRLQTLLQAERLHLPRTTEAETLARELLEFEIRVETDANDRYGAFPVGTHDDLVMALGLAVQTDMPHPGVISGALPWPPGM